MTMITVKEIKQKALNRYSSFLKYKIVLELESEDTKIQNALGENGFDSKRDSFFPLEIQGNKGNPNDDFKKRSAALQELIKASNLKKLYSYALETKDVLTRNNGTQTIIQKIYFENEKSFLVFIEKELEVKRFCEALKIINNAKLKNFEMQTWAEKNIKALCTETEEHFWQNIVLVIAWLKDNPKSDLYIREIPLPIHTKFIENNKKLIEGFFYTANNQSNKKPSFEKILGLKNKPLLFYFRFLDSSFSFIKGMLSPQLMAISLSHFNEFLETEKLKQIQTVFITENKMVCLAFPKVKNALCLLGHGYYLLNLKNCSALQNKQIFYLGDIDEHGFDILSKFRNYFPHTISLCMDKKTYETFKFFAVSSDKKLPDNSIPKNLRDDELEIFNHLRKEPEHNRLEQERITQDYIISQLKEKNILL
ncbi:MAG TPA: Wadjet anti-phage system protein JetD domain-containing protein [Treponemataceae bacterium]|nr:Wadjet anti-phage system protein JetD domain-containing protein [Treponemataceae bacterium]